MFREIYFLRAEDVTMELSPPVSRLLAKVPNAAAAAAISDAASGPTRRKTSLLSRGMDSACYGRQQSDAGLEEKGSGKRRAASGAAEKWANAISLTELLTEISFLVYVATHILAVVAACYWLSLRLVALSAALYCLRMFGITGGYHRLLSHRSYKTSRGGQLAMATIGCLAFQKGPIWWASHHRHHHRTADTEEDAHSPLLWGFWWSHLGWFLATSEHAEPLWAAVPDLARYPELRWLDRYHYIPPLALAGVLYAAGGLPAVGWGYAISTVLCWHATYCINSVAHLIGSRRFRCEFNTHCDARNNFWLSLVTLGEGWHNNHHCYMRSARHGFYAEEVDITWYVLLLLERLGLVWDLELPPLEELEQSRYDASHLQCRCDRVDADLQATTVDAN